MKKLTAVSMYCNGQKVVRFLMLETKTMVRAGVTDIKTTMTSEQFSRFQSGFNAQHGDTVSVG